MFKKIKDRIDAVSTKKKLLIASSGGAVVGAVAAFAYMNHTLNGMVVTDANMMYLPGSFVTDLDALEQGKSLLVQGVETGRIFALTPQAVSA